MDKSRSVAKANFRRLLSSPQCWVILALSVLYMEYIFEPIRLYLIESGSKIGLFDLMTYFMNDATVSGFMILCTLGLLFNIPCADDLQRYMLIRCGRRAWGRAQLRYCLRVCCLYMLFLTLVVLILILPWLEPTVQWSRGVLAFVDDFVYETYDSFLNYDVWLPRSYTPVAAFSVQFLLHVMCTYALGALLANINMIIDRRIGFAVIAVPMAFDLLLEEYFGEIVNYFSPLTLCRLSGLDYADGMGRPPVWAAFAIFAALSLLFSLIFLRHIKKRELRI